MQVRAGQLQVGQYVDSFDSLMFHCNFSMRSHMCTVLKYSICIRTNINITLRVSVPRSGALVLGTFWTKPAGRLASVGPDPGASACGRPRGGVVPEFS